MQQPPPQDLPPTGDQLGEDLYTSATADLSAGGVAMAREAAEEQGDRPGGTLGHASTSSATSSTSSSAPINDPTPAQIYAREDLVSQTERPTFVTDYAGADAAAAEQSPLSRIDPTLAMAGGGLVALAGGIGGAWLFSRWQEERNRPINRLRRQARGMTSLVADVFGDVGERLPDADDVRDTAPMSGGAAAALVFGLVLARLLHVGGWGQSQREAQTQATLREAGTWRRQLRGLQDIDVQAARKKIPNVDVKAARNKVPKVDASAARGPMGLGLGGTIGVAAAVFLVWRLLRGGGSNQRQASWSYENERREEVPNQ
jgi:hypothetical protein